MPVPFLPPLPEKVTIRCRFHQAIAINLQATNISSFDYLYILQQIMKSKLLVQIHISQTQSANLSLMHFTRVGYSLDLLTSIPSQLVVQVSDSKVHYSKEINYVLTLSVGLSKNCLSHLPLFSTYSALRNDEMAK